MTNKNNNKEIYSYGRYDVLVVPDVSGDGDRFVPGYGVVNRDTGVREYESVDLPNALRMCRLMELHVRASITIKDDGSETLFATKSQAAQEQMELVFVDEEADDDEPAPPRPRIH